MINGLYEAHLLVRNLERSIEFYKKLDLELAYQKVWRHAIHRDEPHIVISAFQKMIKEQGRKWGNTHRLPKKAIFTG